MKEEMKIICLICIVSLLIIISEVSINIESNNNDDKDLYWSTFQYNSSRKGLCPYETHHINGDLKWILSIEGQIISSPAIDNNGDIYVGTTKNYFYCINHDGKIKWSFKADDQILSTPSIDTLGRILFGSNDGKVYTFSNEGKLLWTYQTDFEIESSPAIDENDMIYINAGSLIALNQNGILKWIYEMNLTREVSPAIGPYGTIFIGSYDGVLYAINPNGTLKWKFNTVGPIQSTPTIVPNGTIYVGCDDYCLYAINSKGNQIWKYDAGDFIFTSAAIGPDGTIYIGSHDNFLHAIHSNGTLKWKFKTSINVTSSDENGICSIIGLSSAVVSADNIIYVGSAGGDVYAINPDGTQKWNYSLEGPVYSTPAIGKDGTIYAANGGKLIAIGVNRSVSTNPDFEDFFPYIVLILLFFILIIGVIYLKNHLKK